MLSRRSAVGGSRWVFARHGGRKKKGKEQESNNKSVRDMISGSGLHNCLRYKPKPVS